ncbi:MAG: GTP cyclohydrolase I, partial [Dehalococcoidia bacterium]|nr:GTP cyclohydrolase I [Dehalococcoidia bacterium]
MVDERNIEKAVLSIIEAIGEDPTREGMVGTPRRIAEMYAELFMGVDKNPKDDLAVGFE